MRVLLFNLGVDSLRAASNSLAGQGYDVATGHVLAVDHVLALSPGAGTDVARKIAADTQDVNGIMSQLASQRLMRPTTTQGHIGDVLEDKIVYDAATTLGGSGVPLFNRNGKVIGINFRVLRDFGGANLAVPANYAKDLLK